jgi:CBS-domain-containing membrane protein
VAVFAVEPGKRLVIYVGESDSWQGRALYLSILETLHKSGLAGATVMRGHPGFGAHGRVHTRQTERLSPDVSMIIMVVDTPENIEKALPVVKPMLREGLITVEHVEIVKYTHRYLQPLPADRPVSAIMTRNVTTVTPDTPARQVIELLLEQLFKAVPVVDDERHVIGIITEEDLLEKVEMPAHLAVVGRLEQEDLQEFLAQIRHEKTAQHIMTQPVSTVNEDDALGHVAQQMVERNFTRFPVVDAEKRLVGMVSRLDILRAVAGNGAGEQEQAPAPKPGRTLGEIMTPGVPSVYINDDLVDVLQQMLKTNIQYVVVLDEQQRAAGVITEGDLVARVTPVMRRSMLRAIAERVMGTDLMRGHALARDIMSERVLTALQETSVLDAIALMLREGRKRIVVVDDARHPIGIVDRQTLLAASLGN